jgi:putative membrane protein
MFLPRSAVTALERNHRMRVVGRGPKSTTCEETMRRTVITFGVLLAVAACADNTDSGRQYGSAQPSSTTTATAPTVPPQVGQPGQTSQQARTGIAREPGGAQALSGTTGMSTTAMAQLSAAEQAFMIEAAQHGMAEVELGRLAESRGSSAQVRDFGRMMVRDHTQANQELMAIAQRIGMTPPTSLPPAAQAAQMRLQQAQGQEFDRQYIEQQAAGHVGQRAMFQFAANNAKNPDLRNFAQRTLPVIERHIDQLRTIAPMAMRTGAVR